MRELSNLVERLSILYPDSIVDVRHLPEKYQSLTGSVQKKPAGAKPPFNPAMMFADLDDDEEDDDAENLPGKLPADLPEKISRGLADEAFTGHEMTSTASVPMGEDGLDLKEHLASMEIKLIKQALQNTEGVVAHAAKLLKMRRTTLVEKLKKYDIKAS